MLKIHELDYIVLTNKFFIIPIFINLCKCKYPKVLQYSKMWNANVQIAQ